MQQYYDYNNRDTRAGEIVNVCFEECFWMALKKASINIGLMLVTAAVCMADTGI